MKKCDKLINYFSVNYFCVISIKNNQESCGETPKKKNTVHFITTVLIFFLSILSFFSLPLSCFSLSFSCSFMCFFSISHSIQCHCNEKDSHVYLDTNAMFFITNPIRRTMITGEDLIVMKSQREREREKKRERERRKKKRERMTFGSSDSRSDGIRITIFWK